ncbi:MAG: tetratricopeptide repeat protein [Acidobacteria bacterium]|nr:tetratricopeptide repeat protein [Acidobacteriota bacterium]
MFSRMLALVALFQLVLTAQQVLDRAYAALRDKDYDQAIRLFQQGLAADPAKLGPRKDLAYVLLKTGDTEAARDQFAEVMRRDPADRHVALEYAFLAYETRQPIQARRTFDRLRHLGSATAEQAFQNIDTPLKEGIARWQKALEEIPDNFSGHEELAKLAELRDDSELAAKHFERAWQLKPGYRVLLLDLGRVYTNLGRAADAHAALLAASRGAEPRVAELARELLNPRYPYVYEFQRALTLDPANTDLRRELAYLHLEMQNKTEAEREFAQIVRDVPADLLSMAQLGFLKLARRDATVALPLLEKVLKGDDDDLSDRVRTALKMPKVLRRRPETPRAEVKFEAKVLAEKSYEKGYMKDALKYLTIAHENDPLDFDVMLKLGWTNNILKNDNDAVRWFDLARRSPDTKISAEALKAYKNLASDRMLLRTTLWALPMFSSRWQDVFAYSQVKTEIKLSNLPIRPYFSARLLADARGLERARTTSTSPQYLSESAAILGVGFSTPVRHGISGWAEAGTALRFRGRKDQSRVTPDYRAGLIVTRLIGAPLGAEKTGWFGETVNDAVFVSGFNNDVVFVSQNKLGWTLNPNLQAFASINGNTDAKSQYWANFVEFGAGIRTRWSTLPSNVHFTIQALRGVYTRNTGNPRRPNYYDIRAGFWYAITR